MPAGRTPPKSLAYRFEHPGEQKPSLGRGNISMLGQTRPAPGGAECFPRAARLERTA